MKVYRVNQNLFRATMSLAGAFVLALGAEWFYRRNQVAVSIATVTLSLLLCSYVVYLCAPLVAHWNSSHRLRLPWSFRLTLEGLLFVTAVLVVAVAALISGNNLIYLVLSCMLGVIVLSGLVSRLGLSGLQLDISFPRHIFACQRTLARVTVRNLKRWMPSFSLWVGSAPASASHSLHADMDQIYCPMITAGSKAVASVPVTFARRGRFSQGTFWLRSRFPFSFVDRRAVLKIQREVLVYPAVDPLPEIDRILRRLGQLWETSARGDSHDLYRIRPAMPDDSARFVDWKSSARAMSLMVREFTREDQRRLDIIFDRSMPAGPEGEGRFEEAVELCAAAAWRLHLMNAEIHFISDDCSILSSPNSAAIYQILRYLALVEPLTGRAWHVAPNVDNDSERFQLVFSARSKEELPALQSSRRFFLSK